MAIPREKILARRKKYEQRRLKEEAKLKALTEKIKMAEAKILKTKKQEEIKRQLIIGRIFSERMETDEGLKIWFYETVASQANPREKNLFNLSVLEN
jgi:hypothetical protein